MGKAEKISNLSKTNDSFDKFMSELETNMGEFSKQYQAKMHEEIDEFYREDNSCVFLEGKSHRDYQIENEFSLDNIARMIKETSGEVFGREKKPEETDEESKKKAEVVMAVENYTEMATNVAINFLCNVLSSLTMGQVAEYKYDIQHVSVGPGLTLHMLIVEKFYDGKGYFEKKRVIQNFIEYRLIFSRKKARAEADVQYLHDQLDTLVTSNGAYKKIQTQWIELLTSKEYISEKGIGGELHLLGQNYQSIMKDLKEAYENAYQSIQALTSKTDGVLKLQNSGMRLRGTREAGSVDYSDALPNKPLLAYLENN